MKRVTMEQAIAAGIVAPSRGRGLKRHVHVAHATQVCRPLAGAWIETCLRARMRRKSKRRPLAGAWIETLSGYRPTRDCKVAPSRGRGLKQAAPREQSDMIRSPPRGGVD